MNKPPQQLPWVSDLLFLFFIIFSFYLIFLGAHSLMLPDEGRYSEVVREMILSGNYITPHVNSLPFLDKPIFFYWLEIPFVRLLGMNEWGLRLWPALVGTLGCLMVYVTGRKLYDRRTGVLSALILATMPLYYGMSHYVNVDLTVAVFITISLCSFILATRHFHKKEFNYFLWAAYVFSGLAVLTKGLIGIVFPAMIIGFWVLFLQEWKVLKQMHLFSGLLIVFLINAPWYMLVKQANPDFFNYFFVVEQFARYTTSHFNDIEPWWYYFPIISVAIFPWIIGLPSALYSNVSAVLRNKKQYAAELFLLLWATLIFIFFSIPASKTVGYILPVLPPLAILIGRHASLHWGKKTQKIFYVFLIGITIILSGLVIAASFVYLPSSKPLALIINRYAKPEDKVISYQRYYEDLPFYTRRAVFVVGDWDDPDMANEDNWEKELWQGAQFSGDHHLLLRNTNFWALWKGKDRVFMVTGSRDYQRFISQATQFYLLGNYGDIYLLSNLPVTEGQEKSPLRAQPLQ